MTKGILVYVLKESSAISEGCLLVGFGISRNQIKGCISVISTL